MMALRSSTDQAELDQSVVDASFLTDDDALTTYNISMDYTSLATSYEDGSCRLVRNNDEDEDEGEGEGEEWSPFAWACGATLCCNLCNPEDESGDFKVTTSQVAHGASLIKADVEAISQLTLGEFAELVAKSGVIAELRASGLDLSVVSGTDGGSVRTSKGEHDVDDSAIMSELMEPEQIAAVAEAFVESDVDRVRTLMTVASLPMERVRTLIMDDLHVGVNDEQSHFSLQASTASQRMERVSTTIQKDLRLEEVKGAPDVSIGMQSDGINVVQKAVPAEIMLTGPDDSSDMERDVSKVTLNSSVDTADTTLSDEDNTDGVPKGGTKDYKARLNDESSTTITLVTVVAEQDAVEVSEAGPEEETEIKFTSARTTSTATKEDLHLRGTEEVSHVPAAIPPTGVGEEGQIAESVCEVHMALLPELKAAGPIELSQVGVEADENSSNCTHNLITVLPKEKEVEVTEREPRREVENDLKAREKSILETCKLRKEPTDNKKRKSRKLTSIKKFLIKQVSKKSKHKQRKAKIEESAKIYE